jgi:hypothetical protein
MKCEEVEKAMIDYLDNSLDKLHRDEIDKHIENCEKCKDDLEKFRLINQTMSESKVELPDKSLRENFNFMLQSEISKLKSGEDKPVKAIRFKLTPFLRVAAGILILVAGVFIGLLHKNEPKINNSQAQLSELRTEVKEMKEMLMFTMLKEESPSQRIKAVNYAIELTSPDDNVIKALVKTLNYDKNVNVRLAAAYSLAQFSDNKSVRDSLVLSLTKQTEPILQIVLMNILVEKKESSAVKPMEQIISNKHTMKEVKDIAQKSIKVLL